jgi:hypothetical protein
MYGWWIRELMDWSSGHLGKREASTSPYHVARLPGSPIAKSPNRRLDQLPARRVDQSTPCVSAGNRIRLEDKSQIDRPCTAHRRHRGAPRSRWPVGGMLLTYTERERYEYLRASPCPGVAAGENTLWEWPKPGRRQALPAEPDPRGSRSRKSPSSSTACVRRCEPATTARAPNSLFRALRRGRPRIEPMPSSNQEVAR